MNIIKSNIILLHGAVNSMIGGRSENQDDFDFLDTPLGFLCIVCDGMGGGPGGKTASYIAKHEIANTLLNCNTVAPRENAFKMAVAKANEVLESKMREIPSLNGMGSTFVAVLISQDSALIAHAGDSRCYQIRGKKCIYRSKDHSLVAQLVDRKALTEEEARLSPQSNIITRGLGNVSNHVPEIDIVPYKKGDRFILCTDGIWGSMPHKELLLFLIQKTGIQDIVNNLSHEVDNIGFSRGGGHDNHTVAVVEMDCSSLYKDTLSKRKNELIALAAIISMLILSFFVGFIILKSRRNDIASSQTYLNGNNDNCYNSNITINKYSKTKANPSSSIDSIDVDSILKSKSGIITSDSLVQPNKKNIVSEAHEICDSANVVFNRDEVLILIQKIIDGYKNAQDVAETTPKAAQAKIGEIKNQVVGLFEKLHEITVGDSIQKRIDASRRIANDDRKWWVDKTPNEKNLHKLTPTNMKNAKEQVNRLESLKTKV